jgi:hypothetical protein
MSTKKKSPRARTGPKISTPPLDPRASRQVWGPSPPENAPTLTTEISAELTRRAEEQARREQARREAQQRAEETKMEERRKRMKLKERMPLRPETKDEEVARYPGRLERWEEAKALADSRKGHAGEDAQHRSTCASPSTCQDPAHVVPRRPWHEHTKHDLRHLGACVTRGDNPVPIEDISKCPDRDVSHLLPPRPIDVAVEYCCTHMCYPRSDVRSLTECVYMRAPDRAQRQLELKMFGKGAFTAKGGGFGGASVVVREPVISESTLWARRAAGTIYDPAMVAPPES